MSSDARKIGTIIRDGCVEVVHGRHVIETRPPKNGVAMLVADGVLYPHAGTAETKP